MPTVADLVVKYSADTADAEAGAKRVEGGMSNMKKAAVAGALLAGTAVVGFLGKSIFAAANFEQAMDGVSASLGGVGVSGGITEAQFASLSEEARRIGSTTSVGANEAAMAMDLLAKSGISVEEIYGGVAQGVVNVSEATGEAIAQSASSFGTFQNMFRDTGISSTQMSDTIVNAMNASDMSLSELQTGVARLAPVISATGMSFQESSGAIAYFNSMGFSAAEVGTSLTAAFSNLVAPTTEQANAMAAMGISAFDAQGAFVGFPAIMDQVAAATEGMTEQQTAETIATIFGADARDLMTEATKKGGGPLRDYIALMNKSGTAATASATRMDNLKGDFETMTGAIQELMLTIGGAMLPGLRNMTQGLTGAIESVTGFIQSIMQLMDGGLNPLAAAFEAVQNALFGFRDDDTPAWIVSIARGFGDLADLAQGLGDAIGEVIDAFQLLMAGDISGFFDGIGTAATGAWDAITNFLSVVAGSVIDLGSIALSAIISFAGDLPGLAADAWGWIQDHLGLTALAVGTLLFGLPAIAIWGVITFRDDLLALANRGWEWVKDRLGFGAIVGDGTGGPSGYSLPLGEVLMSAVIGWGGDLIGLAQSGWQWVKNELGFGGLTGDGTGGPGGYSLPLGTIIMDAIIDFAGDLKSLVDQGWEWIKGKLPRLAGAAHNLGSIAASAAVDFLGDLKDLIDRGWEWIKSKLPKLAGAAHDLGTIIASAAVDFLGDLKGLIDRGWEWIKGQLPRLAGASHDIGSILLEGVVALGGMLKEFAASPSAWINRAIGTIAWVNVTVGEVKVDVLAITSGMTKDEVQQEIDETVSAWGVLETQLAELGIKVPFISMEDILPSVQLILSVVFGPAIAITRWSINLSIRALDKIVLAGAAIAYLAKAAADAIFAKAIDITKWYLTFDIPDITLPSAGDLIAAIVAKLPTLKVPYTDWSLDLGNPLGGEGSAPGGNTAVAGPGGGGVLTKMIMSRPQLPEGFGAGGSPFGGGGGGGFAAQIQAMTQQASAAIAALGASVARGMAAVVQQAAAGLQPLGPRVQQIVMQMTQQFQAALMQLPPRVQAVTTQVVTMFQTTLMQMPPRAQQIATQVVQMIQTTMMQMPPIVQQISMQTVMMFQAAMMQLPPMASQIGMQTTQSFISAFTPIQPQATQIANSTRQSVTSALQAIVGPAQSAGQQAGSGFVNGFRAINAASGVASGAVGSIRSILSSASSGAFGYGAAVGNQFAAGIRSSLGAVAAAAAALRALMPSSPAEKGPLSKKISWAYIVDDLETNMGRLGIVAERGARQVSESLIAMQHVVGNVLTDVQRGFTQGLRYAATQGLQPLAAALKAVQYSLAAIGGENTPPAIAAIAKQLGEMSRAVQSGAYSAPSVSAAARNGSGVVHNHYYVVKSGEMVQIIKGAEQGRIAHSQQSSRSREIGLGLRGV